LTDWWSALSQHLNSYVCLALFWKALKSFSTDRHTSPGYGSVTNESNTLE